MTEFKRKWLRVGFKGHQEPGLNCPVFPSFGLQRTPLRASLVAQMVKSPPAVWETWTQPLGWEDPLEEGMAAHSSVLAWRIPWTEEPGGLQSVGLQNQTQLSD